MKTKYNIGDRIWFIREYTPFKLQLEHKTIRGIIIGNDKTTQYIVYDFLIKNNKLMLKEEDILCLCKDCQLANELYPKMKIASKVKELTTDIEDAIGILKKNFVKEVKKILLKKE